MNDANRNLARRSARTCVRPIGAAAAAIALVVTVGCRVTVDPIRVEPIHLTLDITLKVDRELDRFFDFEDPGAPPANDVMPVGPVREGDQS